MHSSTPRTLPKSPSATSAGEKRSNNDFNALLAIPVYPFQPRNDVRGAQATLAALIRRHGVELVAIGNGTAGRETEKFLAAMTRRAAGAEAVEIVVVSETGASIYSASEVAREEFPDNDITVRGAVSIGRRLRTRWPNSSKSIPKASASASISTTWTSTASGARSTTVVEVRQPRRRRSQHRLAPLLGMSPASTPSLAETIVTHRNDNGPFRSRRNCTKVPRLGDRAFEQAAGFLRIRGGEQPLDASAVHPEPTASRQHRRRMRRATCARCGRRGAAEALDPRDFVDATFGLPTLQDILAELAKPGRDPRQTSSTAASPKASTTSGT